MVSMVCIRALCFHCDLRLLSRLGEVIDVAREFVREFGIRCLSYRVVFPSGLGGVDWISRLAEVCDDVGADYFAVYWGSFSSADVREVVEGLSVSEKFFTSVLVPWEFALSHDALSHVAKIVWRISEELGWRGCTRFAIVFGDVYETPYFPATKYVRDTVSLSLLYPGDLRFVEPSYSSLESFLKGLGERFLKFLSRLANAIGFPHFGIDYSLSPWLSESVARVFEWWGCPLGSVGCVYLLHFLNEVLRSVAENMGGLGYCEVMLPLAEDDVLKEYVRSGVLNIYDLMFYSSISVAGLDMVPISMSEGFEATFMLIRDYAVLVSRFRRPKALRLILVPEEPGSEVAMGFFGRVPILSMRGLKR